MLRAIETALAPFLETHDAAALMIEARPPHAKELGPAVLGVPVQPAFNVPRGVVRIMAGSVLLAAVRVDRD